MRLILAAMMMVTGVLWGRGQSPQQRPVKCQFHGPDDSGIAKTMTSLGRPDRQVMYISPSGAFAVHYDTTGQHAPDTTSSRSDGVPDWVAEVAIALDSARATLVRLGFEPAPDDGDGRYDVYLEDYGGSVYGNTYTEAALGQGRYTSYLVMDNDFAENYYTHGLDAARITATHEYFHGVQFGYYWRGSDTYWYEISSTWLEDFVYPEVDDWTNWFSGENLGLDAFGNNPTQPISSTDGYSLAIFGHYLTQATDKGIMARIWDRFKTENALAAIESELAPFGTDMVKAWVHFVANLFFNGTAPALYFHPDQALLLPPRTDPATLFGDETFSFYYLRPGKAGIQAFKLLGPSNLELEILAAPQVHAAEFAIGRNQEDYSLHRVLDGPWYYTDLNSLSTLVLVVGAESGSMEVATAVIDTLETLAFALDYLAPNPLVLSRQGQSGLTLKYTVAKSLPQGDHRLVIYNLLGEEIYRRQWFKTVGAGSNTFELSEDIMRSWPSGVYFMTFTIDRRQRFNRSFTILK